MIDRRRFLLLGFMALSGTLTSARPRHRTTRARRLVLVHGRAQQGLDPQALQTAWLAALERGAKTLGRRLPAGWDVSFPYYGDLLDEFVRQADVPLTTDVGTRGGVDQQFLAFEAEMIEEIRKGAGVTDQQVIDEFGDRPTPRGPQNWEWVQAICRAVDRYGGGASQSFLERFMRDVYLYITAPGVRDRVDEVVADALTPDTETVVVAHSLGSVVAYSVLSTDRRSLRVPNLVTLGSPLGLRSIRNRFRPISSPRPVASWYNAYDDRDVVALYALDGSNFPVQPPIVNHGRVRNHTDNRHGIDGYLDDVEVARTILDAVGS